MVWKFWLLLPFVELVVRWRSSRNRHLPRTRQQAFVARPAELVPSVSAAVAASASAAAGWLPSRNSSSFPRICRSTQCRSCPVESRCPVAGRRRSGTETQLMITSKLARQFFFLNFLSQSDGYLFKVTCNANKFRDALTSKVCRHWPRDFTRFDQANSIVFLLFLQPESFRLHCSCNTVYDPFLAPHSIEYQLQLELDKRLVWSTSPKIIRFLQLMSFHYFLFLLGVQPWCRFCMCTLTSSYRAIAYLGSIPWISHRGFEWPNFSMNTRPFLLEFVPH